MNPAKAKAKLIKIGFISLITTLIDSLDLES